MRTLVVGATGATGRFVVKFLLAKNQPVTVFVRSKDRMLELAKDYPNTKELLTIVEGTTLDLPEEQLKKELASVDAVVSCLGHNLTFKGVYGRPRRLVKDSLQRLLEGASPNTKFILMNSDGVTQPNDDPRSAGERLVLFLLRHLLPPHADNEQAAAFLSSSSFSWVGVRPTDLVDQEEPTSYVLHEKAVGGLFGSAVVSRVNVAKFMVDLLTDNDLFAKYKGQFPVVHNASQAKKQD